MPKVPVWLVLPHNRTGQFIDVMQGPGPDVAHACVVLPDPAGVPVVYEAKDPAYCKTPVSDYDNTPRLEYLVEVSDVVAATVKAERLLGAPYGKLSCIEGEIRDWTGLELARGKEESVNCSESVTIVVRAAGGEMCPNIRHAATVTPEAMQDYFDAAGIPGVLKGV